jgi:opacity protein-like surface antigen
MKLFITSSILATLMAVTPSHLLAQTPRTDSAAVGADIGVFLPRADFLKSGLEVDAFYEYYLSPRTSVRLGGGWMNPKMEREDADSMRYFRVGGDLVYNWEGGSIHPFAGAGLGIYFLQEKDNGDNFGDQQTKLGGTLFGGAEFFTSNTLSFKAEAKYHLVSNADAFNPDGLSLTVGLKKYF